jgi:hypothetical protein
MTQLLDLNWPVLLGIRLMMEELQERSRAALPRPAQRSRSSEDGLAVAIRMLGRTRLGSRGMAPDRPDTEIGQAAVDDTGNALVAAGADMKSNDPGTVALWPTMSPRRAQTGLAADSGGADAGLGRLDVHGAHLGGVATIIHSEWTSHDQLNPRRENKLLAEAGAKC